MFSIIFPGQGSQITGMAKEFYQNFRYVRDYYNNADEILNKRLSNIILDGPQDELDLTENTQPAIFLVSYSIYKVLENETQFNLKNAKFFAGHSLGEYSALCCANSINFEQTINLLKNRGKAMQEAVPKGEGGMLAILGIEINEINKILKDNFGRFQCYVANDNTLGQTVVSGQTKSLDLLSEELNKKNIKFIKLSVSAPFHSPLMKSATEKMREKINQTDFSDPVIDIISNVTSKPHRKSEEIKRLLIDQIENPVRWRESVINMISLGINRFIEIGPGKVLSGLIKRIDRKVESNQVNNLGDLKNIEYD